MSPVPSPANSYQSLNSAYSYHTAPTSAATSTGRSAGPPSPAYPEAAIPRGVGGEPSGNDCDDGYIGANGQPNYPAGGELEALARQASNASEDRTGSPVDADEYRPTSAGQDEASAAMGQGTPFISKLLHLLGNDR